MILLTTLTVIILYYYTKETYLLRKESQKQTDAAFTPYLTIRSSDGEIYLSNLGKGIAKDVHFETFSVGNNKICNFPSIAPGEKRELRVWDGKNNGYWGLSTSEAPNTISFQYSDLLGNAYVASFEKQNEYQWMFNELSQRRK